MSTAALQEPRETEIIRFLAGIGWGRALRRAMGADWSSRRYERLEMDGRRAILMDAPGAAAAQVPPFVQIGGILSGLGLSAPVIYGADEPAGLLLLEDFGDATYAAMLDGGAVPALPLYERATDVLVALHRGFRDEGGLPLYDKGLFLEQVMLFADAYVPAAIGRPLGESDRRALADAWAAVLDDAFGVPDSLLLRDYHPGNLMHLEGRPGVASCGLLDYQDAGIGPVSYDLLSLLEDARRDVDPTIQAAMVARYLDAFPALDRAAFGRSYAVLGAVRHARIVGRVAQLAEAQRAAGGSARQLGFLPRVWGQLTAKLSDPALAPVRAWVQTHLPPDGAIPQILGVSGR
ncbi:MAG TPA: phosphotransferase [Azospirillaceae bacterium]|nr:phosphotransferase [Azospirillaceae bacterium]